MKIKYYLNSKILLLVLFSLLISIIITHPSSAALTSSNAYPSSIFKCGGSEITASFDDVGITAVSAILSSEKAVNPMLPGTGRNIPETQSTTITLTNNSSVWTGTFGNDASLLWGNRIIVFNVTNGGTNLYSSSSSVFVYAGTCTGTGVTNYTQVGNGGGRYTSMLYLGKVNLLEWAIYPWIEYWGYMFFVLIIFIVCISVYQKSQNIMQPLLVAFTALIVLSTSSYIPKEYINYIILIEGTIIGIIYYRLFVKEN